jgi:hypothetical protein
MRSPRCMNCHTATDFPAAEVYCVEPKGFDDYRRSLAAGTRQRNDRSSGSICDALLIPEPGELTFAMNKDRLAGGLVVSDHDVREAIAFAYREMKLVVEPPPPWPRSSPGHSTPRGERSRSSFPEAISILSSLRRLSAAARN